MQLRGTVSEPFEAELDGQQFVGCDLSCVDDQVGTGWTVTRAAVALREAGAVCVQPLTLAVQS